MHNIFITSLFDWSKHRGGVRAARVNKLLEQLKIPYRLERLDQSGLMTNVEQRMNMFHLLDQVLSYNVNGDIVELGCHVGQSAVLFAKLMEHYQSDKRLILFDSFSGLPKRSEKDGESYFSEGMLGAKKEQVVRNFKINNVEQPEIITGWFDQTLSENLPAEIAFAHLDGDFYESIMVSLQEVYPRLSEGAICLIDDYCDPAVLSNYNSLPGVKKACDDFLEDKPESVSVLVAGRFAHGYFRKNVQKSEADPEIFP